MSKPVEQRENVGTFTTMRTGTLPAPQAREQRSGADSKLTPAWRDYIGEGLKDR